MTKTVLNTKIGEVDNKIPDTSSLVTPDTSGFVTTTVLNIKTAEVENKIPDTIALVKKTDYRTKISELEKKSILLLLIIMNLGMKYYMEKHKKKD